MDEIIKLTEYRGIEVFIDPYMEHGQIMLGRRGESTKPGNDIYVPQASWNGNEGNMKPDDNNPFTQDEKPKVKPKEEIKISDFTYSYIIAFKGITEEGYKSIIDKIAEHQDD